MPDRWASEDSDEELTQKLKKSKKKKKKKSKKKRKRDDDVSKLVVPTMPKRCRHVDRYVRLNHIQEGSYGVVSRARCRETGDIVALKEVKVVKKIVAKEGFPITATREINILLMLRHPNIIRVREMVVGGPRSNKIYMVMDYMEHDLQTLMSKMKRNFTQSEVKCMLRQLLDAVSYMHRRWIFHRDLKTSNLLYGNDGMLRVADFGLARKYSKKESAKTPKVVTLWYRAPEILFGSVTYDNTIDCWAMGALIGEFLLSEPLIPGKDEISQIKLTIELVGYPTRDFFHYVNHSSEDDTSLPSLRLLSSILFVCWEYRPRNCP